MQIHHVALRTADPERLVAFYVDVLSLKVIRRQPHGVWLALDGAVLMIEQAAPDEPAPDPASLRLLAFAVSEEERARIGARVEVEDRTAFTWYFRDPDGRRLGISTYAFDEAP